MREGEKEGGKEGGREHVLASMQRLLGSAGEADVFIRGSLILVVAAAAQIAGRDADTILASGPSPAFYLPPPLPATSRSAALRSRCLLWRQHRCAGKSPLFIRIYMYVGGSKVTV